MAGWRLSGVASSRKVDLVAARAVPALCLGVSKNPDGNVSSRIVPISVSTTELKSKLIVLA